MVISMFILNHLFEQINTGKRIYDSYYESEEEEVESPPSSEDDESSSNPRWCTVRKDF